MNNVTKELIGQFIFELLDDECGINKNAKELLEQLMINDRDMANILHDTIGMAVENSDGRFVINP
jgi:hypothetical protein